jgi:hypothetical protein
MGPRRDLQFGAVRTTNRGGKAAMAVKSTLLLSITQANGQACFSQVGTPESTIRGR